MAKQGISTGTTPNDGSGDSLLNGAVKINSNFDEVYAAIGNGSTVSTPVTSITAGDNITVSSSTGAITITGIGTADIDTDRINVSGVVTATSFSGSGANLTNLPAAALVGTLPALDGSNLTGVTTTGAGVTVQDGGSDKGTASIINFGSNLSVTTVNSGITTITAGAANTSNLNSDTIVVGVLTATTFGSDLTLGTGRDVVFSSSSGINASTSTENLHWGSGNLYFNSGSPEINWLSGGGNIRVTGAASTISILGGNPAENMAVFKVGGAAELYYDNNKKLETTGSGTTTYGTALTQQLNVTGVSTFSSDVHVGSGITFTSNNDISVTGVSTLTGNVFVGSGSSVTAGSFYGDGSELTDGKWTLGANGNSDYTFTGIGFTQTTNDPILYLARGRVYEFVNTMGAHPFQIRESVDGNAYNNGVTNNTVSNGTLRFEIPFNAPNTLYYQCTSHAGMGSTIVVYPNTI